MNAARRHSRLPRTAIRGGAVLAMLAAVLLMARSPHLAAAQEPTASGSDELVVRDVAVFLLDVRGKKLNDQGLFRSTLPPFVLRPRLPAGEEEKNQPSPVGLVTIEGGFEQEMDVLLEFPQGRILSHWPPSRTGLHRALWQNVLAQPSAEPTAELPEEHWLAPLRRASRMWLSYNGKTDRFLLYDLELEYESPLGITREEGGYRVENTGNWPIHDVMVFKPRDEGRWEVGAVAELGPSGEPPKPAEPRTPGTSLLAPRREADPAEVESLFENDPGDDTDSGEDTTEPEPEKAPAPTSAVVHSKAFEAAEPEAPFAALRRKLGELGLGEPEVRHAAGIVEHQVRSRHHATIVYRLNPDQLDRIMPLEFTPPPDRRVRVALVVLVNADPELSEVIDRLIAELGDDDWRTREAAVKGLRELGTAAKDKLEKAKNDKDVEIAYRAERLLKALESPLPMDPDLPAGAVQAGGFF